MMKNKDQNNKNMGDMPDFEDEQYWRQFEKELWTLLRKQKPISPERVKICLTFARCREIAGALEKITNFEKDHLDKCRYCDSRVQKFVELNTASFSEEPQTLPAPEKGFFQKVVEFFHFQPLAKPAFAAFGLLFAVIFFGWLVFISLRQTYAPDDNIVFSETENRSGTLENRGYKSVGAENINQPTKAGNSTDILTPHPMLSPNTDADGQKPETLNALEGVPEGERAAVTAALETGKIPSSEELRLFQTSPVARGARSDLPKPLSPVNRVVIKSNPVLSWKGNGNTEYVVIVTDRAGRERDNSGKIKKTSWQVSKPLPTDLYFWKVTAKKADSEKTVESPVALFKVISGQEKAELENTGKKVESRLAKAIIYYRAGLLDEAERELQTELKKNPNSPLAKSFLRQVRDTKQKIERYKDQP